MVTLSVIMLVVQLLQLIVPPSNQGLRLSGARGATWDVEKSRSRQSSGGRAKGMLEGWRLGGSGLGVGGVGGLGFWASLQPDLLTLNSSSPPT